jgi:hypothetical protein
MTELFSTSTVSESPPKMTPIRIIPKKESIIKTKIPITVAKTFPKNLIVSYFLSISL